MSAPAVKESSAMAQILHPLDFPSFNFQQLDFQQSDFIDIPFLGFQQSNVIDTASWTTRTECPTAIGAPT
jgi:hypothetical protein